MRRSLALVTLGIAAIVGALALGTAPAPTPVGDVASFETSPARVDISTPTTTQAPTPPDPLNEEPPPTEAATAAPLRFTVAAAESGQSLTPVRIWIPAIGRDAPIVPAGVASNGDMEVPDSADDVAWYRFGPAPGEAGSAVLAAHVDLAGQGPGVFFDLAKLEPGDIVVVEFDDGSTETYRTEARTTYEKSELPTESIFRRDGPPVLTLITCGGDFNRQVRSYDSNVVVYAVPLDDNRVRPAEAA